MKDERVLYLDPSLGRALGHHTPLARGFSTLLAPSQLVLAGAAGGMLEHVPQNANFVPAFHYRLADAFRVSRAAKGWMGRGPVALVARAMMRSAPSARLFESAAGPELSPAAFRRLLAGLHAEDTVAPLLAARAWRDVVCIAADPAMLSALHNRAAVFAGECAPQLHIVFMYPEADFLGASTEPAYFALVRDMMTWPRPPRLYAELADHSRDIATKVGAPVFHQVLPYRAKSDVGIAPSSPFTVAVLGAGRRDKAFDLLPAIVDAVRARDPAILFRIQRPILSAVMWDCRRALAAQSSVTLLPASLDENAYSAELARASVVLLAYDAKRYARRGSGIFVDALMSARPIVCVADTALAHALSDNGLTGAGAEGLADAIVEARQRHTVMSEAALRARDQAAADIEGGPLFTALHRGEPAWA
jgi:hypothetical protein